MAYIELSKWVQTLFTVPSEVRSIEFWEDGSSQTNSIVAFTAWWIYSNVANNTWIDCFNSVSTDTRKYFFSNSLAYQYTNIWTVSTIWTFNNVSWYRPSCDYFGDIIIWDWNQTARINESTPTTLTKYISGTSNSCLHWLDGTIYAITVIWVNVYIWCNNNTDTVLYIWDGSSDKPSQVIYYRNKFFHNAIPVNNSHIWWAGTWAWIREVVLGQWYDATTYVKTGYPKYPISTYPTDDLNRNAFYVDRNFHLRAIESMDDVVFLPWYGKIFSFGNYMPGGKYSFGCDYSFTGEYVTAMLSWGQSWSLRNYSLEGKIVFSTKNGSTYDINLIDKTQEWWYASLWTYESMEWIASDMYKGENDVKITVPCYLPDSSTSIKVYEKRDGWSYSEIKTISYADYPWFNVVEVKSQGKWRTKQLKFELITSDSDFSPRLYIWVNNETTQTWKI